MEVHTLFSHRRRGGFDFLCVFCCRSVQHVLQLCVSLFFHFIYALKDTRMQIASPGQGKNAKVNPDIQSWSKHHKY